jgi:hypothetical protein
MSTRRPTTRMVPLGYGKFVRADRIVMLQPLTEDEGRGDGARTRVWVDGVPDPVIASRSERAILDDMGEGPTRPRGARAAMRAAGQDELF